MNVQEIGIAHSAVKELLRIRRSKLGHRLVIAEGLWAAKGLLALRTRIDTFFFCPDLVHSAEAMACALELMNRARRSYKVSAKVMKRMARRDHPEGLLSLADIPKWRPEDLTFSDDALVVIADGIESPGNLGTLLRTADATRAECLLVTNRRTSVNHEGVLASSRGMNSKVPYLEFEDPSNAIRWLRSNKFTVCVANPGEGTNYRQLDYIGRVAIVLGNERFGPSRHWYEHGFQLVCIPVLGMCDSLNVAVAASILLYEARARKDGW
jgi:RNA methyltransferase, TrmH family